MHTASAFVTLTYSDDMLPAHGSLVKRDLQLFMKRLRDAKFRATGLQGIRFYACGEYGERTRRPHYHVLLLNTSFSDLKKRSWGLAESRNETYVSAELSRLWTCGSHVIGSVSFESAAYVARYCTKIVTGPEASDYYQFREREFAVMSRRPGLGTGYFEKFGREAYRHDNVIVDGREAPLNRFYDSKYEILDAAAFADIKDARRRKMLAKPFAERKLEASSRRRVTREEVTRRTLAHFKKDEL